MFPQSELIIYAIMQLCLLFCRGLYSLWQMIQHNGQRIEPLLYVFEVLCPNFGSQPGRARRRTVMSEFFVVLLCSSLLNF
jgi:hypothetical protein